MDRGHFNPYGHNPPYQQFRSPNSPRFSNRPSPPRFSPAGQSTPTRSPRPPRLQGSYSSRTPVPRGPHWGNNSNSGFLPTYTPSPIQHRPSYQSNRPYNSPHHSFRGDRGRRGRGGRGGHRSEKAAIETYFSEEMLKDPWEGLKPYPFSKSKWTTT